MPTFNQRQYKRTTVKNIPYVLAANDFDMDTFRHRPLNINLMSLKKISLMILSIILATHIFMPKST